MSSYFYRASVAIVLILAPALRACAADPVSLFPPTVGWTLSRPTPTTAVLATPRDAAVPGQSVMQIDITQPTQPFYALQLTRPLVGGIKINDRIRYSFWARGTNNNGIRVVVEGNSSPWTAVLSDRITLTDEWHPYVIEMRVDTLPASPLAARLQLGESDGRVSFGDIQVQDLGTDPSVAQAQLAVQKAAIAARIRKYRMGDLTVTVLSAGGKPIPGATIRLEQTRHAFLFGCNFFGLEPDTITPAQVAYRTEFAALLNYATLPFYWSGFEYQMGNPNYGRLSAMAEWCGNHAIVTKGHPLVWHESYPGWGPAKADDAIPVLHKRVDDIIGHYLATIRRWDIVNEANGAGGQNPPNGESRWVQRDGPAKVVETVLGWARDAGADNDETYIYNDYDTGPANVGLLQQMQRDGKLPDTIGIQSHMHQGTWPMTKVWLVCQTFAQFSRPLNFTEVTVLSGPMRPEVSTAGPFPDNWLTTPAGEKAQADYVSDFYTVLFSHPNVHAITWWDFSDQNAWMQAPAGLVRKDMSPKPAYNRLMQLIHHDWWTDIAGKTSSAGRFTGHVYYGAYTIYVRDPRGRLITQNVWFPEGSNALKTVLRLTQ